MGDKFTRETIGDENYHVAFPFVNLTNEVPNKVIKPLHLDHDEPTKIYDHGASWIYRINKLKGKFIDPNRVLFTLSGPHENQNRLKAYGDVRQELEEAGVQVVPADDKDKIINFALH